MEVTRAPLQGVTNIIRFNWHFYVLSFGVIVLLAFMARNLDPTSQQIIYVSCVLISIPILISLFVSLYVYDMSGLYKLDWIDSNDTDEVIININAGFDETSVLLKQKFPNAQFTAMDFYNPTLHTEVSIKRARVAYPAYPGTISIGTNKLPLTDQSADKIFLILAAHEIRDPAERAHFFKELARVIKPTGEIFVTEHVRDLPNFLAYNIGFLHFHSHQSWMTTFRSAGLTLIREKKLTPFISTFILTLHGDTH